MLFRCRGIDKDALFIPVVGKTSINQHSIVREYFRDLKQIRILNQPPATFSLYILKPYCLIYSPVQTYSEYPLRIHYLLTFPHTNEQDPEIMAPRRKKGAAPATAQGANNQASVSELPNNLGDVSYEC